MNKLPMSRPASALLRALIDRSGEESDRILLTEIQSVDWQSLTLSGEQHRIVLRVSGPRAEAIARLMTDGLEDAEFSIPGQIVADIAADLGPVAGSDGSVSVSIQALTIAE